jgi:hypothetical protein
MMPSSVFESDGLQRCQGTGTAVAYRSAVVEHGYRHRVEPLMPRLGEPRGPLFLRERAGRGRSQQTSTAAASPASTFSGKRWSLILVPVLLLSGLRRRIHTFEADPGQPDSGGN